MHGFLSVFPQVKASKYYCKLLIVSIYDIPTAYFSTDDIKAIQIQDCFLI